MVVRRVVDSRCTAGVVAELHESDERYGSAAPDMVAWLRPELDTVAWLRSGPGMAELLQPVWQVDSDSRSIRWAGCWPKCPPVPMGSASVSADNSSHSSNYRDYYSSAEPSG